MLVSETYRKLKQTLEADKLLLDAIDFERFKRGERNDELQLPALHPDMPVRTFAIAEFKMIDQHLRELVLAAKE